MMMCCWNGKQPVCKAFYQYKSLWVVPVSISILWGGGRGYGGQNNPTKVCKTFVTASGAANGSLVFCFTAKINSFKTKKQCAVCQGRRGLAGAILHSVLMGQLWSVRRVVRLFL